MQIEWTPSVLYQAIVYIFGFRRRITMNAAKLDASLYEVKLVVYKVPAIRANKERWPAPRPRPTPWGPSGSNEVAEITIPVTVTTLRAMQAKLEIYAAALEEEAKAIVLTLVRGDPAITSRSIVREAYSRFVHMDLIEDKGIYEAVHQLSNAALIEGEELRKDTELSYLRDCIGWHICDSGLAWLRSSRVLLPLTKQARACSSADSINSSDF